jgi:predicted HD superfamily hydrolase involved in NAD metabolism
MGADIPAIVGREKTELLKTMLKPGRFAHSMGAAGLAVELAVKYSQDVKKAALAGLLHDCAKDLDEKQTNRYIKKYRIKLDPVSKKIKALWHCHIGPYVAREKFGIKGRVILDAIANHTAGRAGMDNISKIVYISDFAEEGRVFWPSRSARKKILSKISLDELTVFVLKEKMKYLIDGGKLIHPDSILLWNALHVYIKV